MMLTIQAAVSGFGVQYLTSTHWLKTRPLVGIELDDSSHDRPDRRERDKFVDSVYSSACFPLCTFVLGAHMIPISSHVSWHPA